jgi:transcriptional regulator with XRE-family HTH domain
MTATTPTQRVAENARAEVARSGLAQSSLAATLGLKQQSLSRRLHGRTPFSVDEAFAVADLLGVPASEIFPTSRVLG